MKRGEGYCEVVGLDESVVVVVDVTTTFFGRPRRGVEECGFGKTGDEGDGGTGGEDNAFSSCIIGKVNSIIDFTVYIVK